MNQPYIIGWGHTPFGKFDAVDPEQLVREAIEPALHTAGLFFHKRKSHGQAALQLFQERAAVKSRVAAR